MTAFWRGLVTWEEKRRELGGSKEGRREEGGRKQGEWRAGEVPILTGAISGVRQNYVCLLPVSSAFEASKPCLLQ